MDKSLNYPIDPDWSIEELCTVIDTWTLVEQAYQSDILLSNWKAMYRAFKQVIPSKSEEKRFDAIMKEQTGYSLYRVTQAAKEADQNRKESIQMLK